VRIERFVWLSGFLCAVLFAAAPLRAAGTVDQQLIQQGAASLAGVSNGIDYAQTFTVGTSGLLDRIEAQVEKGSGARAPTAPLIVEIRRTLAGVPDPSAGGVLASFTVPAAQVPGSAFQPPYLGVDLGAAAVPVASGDVLAVSLRSPSAEGRSYGWIMDESNRYKRGDLYIRSPDTAGQFIRLSDANPGNPPFLDAGFRTFVTVPEPSAVCFGVVAAYVVLTLRGARRPRAHSGTRGHYPFA
jgi:hypothetical protein